MNGICVVSVAPLRAEPSHKSEMVSQVLFGEKVEILSKDGDFYKVITLFDNYTGWCQIIQITETDIEFTANQLLAGEWVNKLSINGQFAFIPFGSELSAMQVNSGRVGDNMLEFEGTTIQPHNYFWNPENVKQAAFTFFNTPYLWGGRSVFGIDCSGFTQMVYKCFNVPLLRDASQQATQGEVVGFLQEVKTGDLAFFDNDEAKIVHVGILLDSKTIIHASGKVRIDGIDNMGIVNMDTGRRTHKLRLIKRLID